MISIVPDTPSSMYSIRSSQPVTTAIARALSFCAARPRPDSACSSVETLRYAATRNCWASIGFCTDFFIYVDLLSVYQSDVLVVLNAHLDRIQAKKIAGAPDLVVEVASQSTAAVDRVAKFEVYARARVAEYWIVKPESHEVEVFALE